MAVNRETLSLLQGMRVSLDSAVDATTRDLVRQWGTAWNEVSSAWQAAVDDLIAVGDGAWPTRSQIMRAERAQRALQVTREALDALSEQAGVTILQPVPQLTDEAAAWQARLTASQLPTVAGTRTELTARFSRVDPRAIESIVTRATGQIESTLRPLSREAAASMRASLIRGVAIGDNPRVAAARMVRIVQGDFAGGLTRALTIARTETLDAHRNGAWAQDQANADVLAGWTWSAELDRRTCPSCWVQNGTVYPVSDPGPWDHQNGRCARVPTTLSWKQLGFDIDEPPSLLPDAKAVFDGLPEADQLAIMGPQRLELLKSGQVPWSDLTQRRDSEQWRTSFGVRPVRDLRKQAAA